MAIFVIDIYQVSSASQTTLTINPVINSTKTYVYYNYTYEGTGWAGGWYLYNLSAGVYLNETRLNDTIDSRVSGISETDPYWTSNYTSCSSSQKLYFDANKNLACGADLGGSVETDPYWTANQSSYSTTTDMNTAIGNANTSMKTYVDGKDTSYNSSMKTYVDAVNGTAGTYTIAVNATMKTYVDGKDIAINSSATGYCIAVDTETNTSLKNWVTGQNYLTSFTETDPYWSANYSGYNKASWDTAFTYVTNNTFYLATNPNGYISSYTESDPQIDILSAGKWCSSNGSVINCTSNPPSVGSETDPYWTSNYTVCSSSQKLYFDANKNLACGADLGGSVETDPYWTANQSSYYTIIQANSSYIKFSDWLNCTGSNNFTNILGGCQAVSFSGYYTSTETDTQIGNANTSMKTYVDGRDTATNSSATGYCIAVDTNTNTTLKNWVTGQNYLTGFTETDPYWTANQSSYSTTTDMNTAISNANTSMKNYVDGTNSTMKNYVDGKDSAYNSSMKTYVDAVNGTMKNYVDGQGFLKTVSGLTGSNMSANLDISILSSAKNITVLNGNITISQDYKWCLNGVTCTKYIMANSTGILIQG